MFIDEFGFVYLLDYPFESSVHPSIIDAGADVNAKANDGTTLIELPKLVQCIR